MSQLHSETDNIALGLKVRVKLVDLAPASAALEPLEPHAKRNPSNQASNECLSAIASQNANRVHRSCTTARGVSGRSKEGSRVEICALNGRRIPIVEFEAHLDGCKICSNRVELQLEFIEALEGAVYRRIGAPAASRVNGAMLISAPELNFAVCGELDID